MDQDQIAVVTDEPDTVVAAEGDVVVATEPEPEAVATGEADAVVAPPKKTDDRKRWYVIHTYSGYENKVKANLERRIR